MRGCLISLISHYINKIQVCNFFSIYIHMKRYIPVFMLFENMNISRITHKSTYTGTLQQIRTCKYVFVDTFDCVCVCV